MMECFRAEYTSKGMSVDHLDGNCRNNRLSNLTLMTRKQNHKKQMLLAALEKLNVAKDVADNKVRWFCWAERFDRVSIHMRAGYCSTLQAPVYLVDDVVSAKSYLRELERLIEIASDGKYFQKLRNQFEKKEEATHE